MVGDFEIDLINKYANSKILGGTSIGNFIHFTKDLDLKLKLVWHSEEEIRHGGIWLDLMKRLEMPLIELFPPKKGGYPTYHTHKIGNLLEALISLHVFELRVPFHFQRHLEWTKNEKVKLVLKQLIAEEGPHLSWVRDYLKKEYAGNFKKVREVFFEFFEWDKACYIKELEIWGNLGLDGREFVSDIREGLEGYEKDFLDYINCNFPSEEEISREEEFIISKYGVAELSGALMIGRWARKVDDPFLRNKLTWHCSEETRHAFIWEALIKELGIRSGGIHDGSEDSFFRQMSEASNIEEFLCAVHIFELRVPFHFQRHLEWTKNEKVKLVLKQLIAEEGPHLSWVRDYLLSRTRDGNKEIVNYLRKFSEIERKDYENDLRKFDLLGQEGGRFGEIIKLHIEEFNMKNEEYVKIFENI